MNKTKLLLFLPFIVFVSVLSGQNNFSFVKHAGGVFNDKGKAICTDIDGNIYITGAAEGEVVFDGQTIDMGVEDIFVAKYNPDGYILWVRNAGSELGQESGLDICADEEGNCYVTGAFVGTADFSGTNLTSRGYKDIFIAKYSTDGTLVWVKSAGGEHPNYGDYGAAITMDTENNILVTGFIYGMSYFETDSIIEVNDSSYSGVFLAKYDNGGNLLWVRSDGPVPNLEGFGIGTDGENNIYITGTFFDVVRFDSHSYYLPDAGKGFFLAKYDNEGNFQWARTPDSVHNRTYGENLVVSDDGDCFVTGYFDYPITIDGEVTNNLADENDAFVIKFDSNGNYQWAKSIGGVGCDRAYSVALDSDDNIWLTGRFEGTAFFDDITLTSNGFWDIFVAKYDAEGNALQAFNAGGATEIPLGYDEQGNDIFVDAGDNCFLTGTFKGVAEFGSLSVDSWGNADIFIAKVNPDILDAPIKKIAIGFNIFPNPNSGDFFIENKVEVANSEIGKVEIIDIYGRIVYSVNQVDDESLHISLPEIISGLYFVNIERDGISYVEKIVIQ